MIPNIERTIISQTTLTIIFITFLTYLFSRTLKEGGKALKEINKDSK